MSLDFATLVIQAYGSGKASIAAKDGNDPEPGGKMMMLGVIAQMIGTILVRPLVLNNFHLSTHILSSSASSEPTSSSGSTGTNHSARLFPAPKVIVVQPPPRLHLQRTTFVLSQPMSA